MVSVVVLFGLVAGADALIFRPPAIPLITTDPFTQVWMRGSTSTSAGVTHWDGDAKTTTGMIRIDGETFTYLGNAAAEQPAKPGPVTKMDGYDAAAGECGIGNHNIGEDECNERCYAEPACVAYVVTVPPGKCWLKSCKTDIKASGKRNLRIITGPHPTPAPTPVSAVVQTSVVAGPTKTVFEFEIAGKVGMYVDLCDVTIETLTSLLFVQDAHFSLDHVH
jgi:hypothetical protein